ncbi:hypothetical protein OS188_12900 [Xanthomarina sp. F1114]|uniref:hypothetical protein n=1 Tax=Xanthomarina sp. F1114 TaxID=2996019 RepID=UPI00225DE800|nr:hypothetical protein [Xanthomarina sp. F1114]MCX7548851.1 hypothetical protein [Xanthomarina sp. F1114]
MNKDSSKNQITRNEALKRMGKYAALTAVGTFLILSPKKAHAQSVPLDPGGNPFE